MNFLKKMADRFENTMTAVAFAEAGEFETAKKIMKQETNKNIKSSKRRIKRLRPASAR